MRRNSTTNVAVGLNDSQLGSPQAFTPPCRAELDEDAPGYGKHYCIPCRCGVSGTFIYPVTLGGMTRRALAVGLLGALPQSTAHSRQG
jgi:hypothetical protein